MYHIAICDDDSKYISILENLIYNNEKCPKDIQFNHFLTGEDLLHTNVLEYDLVIMDMQMSGLNGYETAKQVREYNNRTVLVFCTGVCVPMPDYFDVQPFRYLMKQYSDGKMQTKISEILEEMVRKKEIKYLHVVNDGKAAKINIDDILYISRLKRGSKVWITEDLKEKGMEKNIISNQKLDNLYEELREYGFEQPHTSYIVNLNHIIWIENSEIILVNGEHLVITRSCKNRFHKSFSNYFGKKYRRGVLKNE